MINAGTRSTGLDYSSSPILVILYRARPHRRRLANLAAVAVGTSAALPGVAAILLNGVCGNESALLVATGADSVSAAITGQIAGTTMGLLYLLLPLGCFEVFETLRGAFEAAGSMIRRRPFLQQPHLLLGVTATYFVAGFVGVLPAVLGGDRRVWEAPPASFVLAALAVGGAALVGYLLPRSGGHASASIGWWALVASVAIFSGGIVEAVMVHLSFNFPNAFHFTPTLADPTFLSPEASALLPWAIVLVAGLALLAAKRRGPALCLLFAAFLEFPVLVRTLGDVRFELFGIDEFDLALTVFVACVLILGRPAEGVVAENRRRAATALLAVSTAATFGSIAIDLPARGAYVGALVLAAALTVFRAADINGHAKRNPETAAALVVALVFAAVVSALLLQFSLYSTGTTDGEPTLLGDWDGYIASAGRLVAPLLAAVWFMPDLLGGKSSEEGLDAAP